MKLMNISIEKQISVLNIEFPKERYQQYFKIKLKSFLLKKLSQLIVITIEEYWKWKNVHIWKKICYNDKNPIQANIALAGGIIKSQVTKFTDEMKIKNLK